MQQPLADSKQPPSRIRHLWGRDKRIAATGWADDEAEWIALVCLHGGVFTRRQFEAHFGRHPELARRFVHRLCALGRMKEGPLIRPRDGRPTQVYRFSSEQFYRTLGILSRRRTATEDEVWRRLLSLDYVIDHVSNLPDAEWFPTEKEKVETLEHLGFDETLFPQRVYRGAGRDTVHFSPLKLPIACIPEQRTFLFVYVDTGHDTDTELRHWGVCHELLWKTMRAKRFHVHIVGIGTTIEERVRTSSILQTWAQETRGGATLSQQGIVELKKELKTLHLPLADNGLAFFRSYGGVKKLLDRAQTIKNTLRDSGTQAPRIDTYSIWTSRRLSARVTAKTGVQS